MKPTPIQLTILRDAVAWEGGYIPLFEMVQRWRWQQTTDSMRRKGLIACYRPLNRSTYQYELQGWDVTDLGRQAVLEARQKEVSP